MLVLRQIATIAAERGRLSLGDVLSLTYVRGPQAAHLGKPGSKCEGRGAAVNPLALDAEVRGEFLQFWYWRPPMPGSICMILEPRDSLAELEERIVGPAGVLNTFTGFLLAFVGGKYEGYKVRGAAGDVLANNGFRVCSPETARATPADERYVFWDGLGQESPSWKAER